MNSPKVKQTGSSKTRKAFGVSAACEAYCLQMKCVNRVGIWGASGARSLHYVCGAMEEAAISLPFDSRPSHPARTKQNKRVGVANLFSSISSAEVASHTDHDSQDNFSRRSMTVRYSRTKVHLCRQNSNEQRNFFCVQTFTMAKLSPTFMQNPAAP